MPPFPSAHLLVSLLSAPSQLPAAPLSQPSPFPANVSEDLTSGQSGKTARETLNAKVQTSLSFICSFGSDYIRKSVRSGWESLEEALL